MNTEPELNWYRYVRASGNHRHYVEAASPEEADFLMSFLLEQKLWDRDTDVRPRDTYVRQTVALGLVGTSIEGEIWGWAGVIPSGDIDKHYYLLRRSTVLECLKTLGLESVDALLQHVGQKEAAEPVGA